MKPAMLCLFLMAGVLLTHGQGEETGAGTSPIPAEFEARAVEEVEIAPEPAPVVPEPPPLRRPITYGGFLTELARAERPAQTFSLRRPMHPVLEPDSTIDDPKTGRTRGFVLFAIRW
jgi:hypothetical protein